MKQELIVSDTKVFIHHLSGKVLTEFTLSGLEEIKDSLRLICFLSFFSPVFFFFRNWTTVLSSDLVTRCNNISSEEKQSICTKQHSNQTWHQTCPPRLRKIKSSSQSTLYKKKENVFNYIFIRLFKNEVVFIYLYIFIYPLLLM